MTQEDKKLLLKDLCTRSPYGLICSIYRIDDWNVGWKDEKLTGYFMIGTEYEFYFGESPISIDNIFKIKPYLCPMSSMTEEEKNEFDDLWEQEWEEAIDAADIDYSEHSEYSENAERLVIKASYKVIEWLCVHHIDYRGLIEKGLAIRVTPENNPYKE